MKHTPGPWVVEDKDGMQGCFHLPIFGGDPESSSYLRVAEVQPELDGDDDFVFTPTVEANARLIAASPRMYELMRRANVVLLKATLAHPEDEQVHDEIKKLIADLEGES